MDQYGDAHYPPATPVPSELHESTVIHTWYSPEWYDPPTGLPVARTVQEIAETGRDVLVSFPWYLSANASSGPSFESMWFQDVVSNKTCTSTAAAAANEKNNTDTKTTGLQKSSSNTMKTQQQQQHDLNCTCFGRRGDVEASCYDVSGSPELLERVLGAEIASFFWPCLAIVILKTMNIWQDKLGRHKESWKKETVSAGGEAALWGEEVDGTDFSFGRFSCLRLCLSRACLGKSSSFSFVRNWRLRC
jgi:hypothetical protein